MKKKAYFFTLDVFIATGVIAIGTVLILLAYTSKPPDLIQKASMSQDLMDAISSIKVYEISDNNYVYELIGNGDITNLENTILEQIGEFCYRDMNDTATNFTESVFLKIIPQEYNFQLLIKDKNTIKFDYINYSKMKTLRNESRILVPSKNIIFGLNDSTMWGPYTAEVRTW